MNIRLVYFSNRPRASEGRGRRPSTRGRARRGGRETYTERPSRPRSLPPRLGAPLPPRFGSFAAGGVDAGRPTTRGNGGRGPAGAAPPLPRHKGIPRQLPRLVPSRRPEATSARARRLASPAPARPARSPRLLRGYGAAHPARFGPGLPCPRLRRGSAFAAPPLLREPPEGPRPLESTRLTPLGPRRRLRLPLPARLIAFCLPAISGPWK